MSTDNSNSPTGRPRVSGSYSRMNYYHRAFDPGTFSARVSNVNRIGSRVVDKGIKKTLGIYNIDKSNGIGYRLVGYCVQIVSTVKKIKKQVIFLGSYDRVKLLLTFTVNAKVNLSFSLRRIFFILFRVDNFFRLKQYV